MTEQFDQQMEENASLLQRLAPTPLTRRRALFAGGAGALGLLAAACGGENDPFVGSNPDPDLTTSTTTEGGGGGGGDLEVAKTAASLEVLAVNTYGAALEAPSTTRRRWPSSPPRPRPTTRPTATPGTRCSPVPARLRSPISPAELEATVNDQFSQVTDVAGVAALALMLEQTAADTYFAVIPQLKGEDAIKLAASIQPIDMQHAAILNYVMGEYPVPKAFATTDMAFTG